jgi:hypothetical protein
MLDLEYLPWPLDLNKFQYTERKHVIPFCLIMLTVGFIMVF